MFLNSEEKASVLIDSEGWLKVCLIGESSILDGKWNLNINSQEKRSSTAQYILDYIGEFEKGIEYQTEIPLNLLFGLLNENGG